jgi:hypothetical protein
MRSTHVSRLSVVALLCWAGTAAAQNGAVDPRDLSGHWDRMTPVQSFSNVPTAPGRPGIEAPLTAAGRARWEQNRPGYGPRATAESRNDPLTRCEPLGLVRNLTTEIVAPHSTFEIVQLPGRMLQLFEYHHDRREVWADGRSLPALAQADPKWLGYSVGRWEGNTFVVDSLGFDDRTWLDKFGFPHTDQMRVEERYRRVDADTLELVITVTDPEYYTKPWVSDTKRFRRNREKTKVWEEQIYCNPAEAFEFNELIHYNRPK